MHDGHLGFLRWKDLLHQPLGMLYVWTSLSAWPTEFFSAHTYRGYEIMRKSNNRSWHANYTQLRGFSNPTIKHQHLKIGRKKPKIFKLSFLGCPSFNRKNQYPTVHVHIKTNYHQTLQASTPTIKHNNLENIIFFLVGLSIF